MRSRRYTLIAGSSLLILASASGAQTPASDTGAAAPKLSLEEIVVTARRKDESMQDVPQVVDAVTPEALAKYNIQSFQDVALLVPGLTLSNDGSGFAAKAAIRGANFEINSATSPTVAFYMNEAVLDANFLLQSMFDVGQIEVLRGPQGTLRGRSAPSGAITVTTHKADLSGFGGYAAVTGTDRDQIKGEGALNLPLVEDMLAIRVAGVVDDNQFDHVRSVNASADPHQHTSAERVSVNFVPSDAFSLTSTYQHLERNLRSYVQLAGSGALGAATPGGCAIQGSTGNIAIPCPAAGYNGPVLTSEDRAGVQNQALPVTTKYDVFTAQADYRFAGQKLSYVGGYSNQKVHAFAYADSANLLRGGRAQLQETFTQQSQVSHELRVASEERVAGLFDYTIGAYFGLEKPDVELPWPASYLNGAFGGGPLPNPNLLDERYLIHTDTEVHGRREERSVFGSVTWHITDNTEFTGGGRYLIAKTDERLAVDLRSDGIIAIPSAFLGIPAGVTCAQAGFASTYAGQCDVPSSLVAASGRVLTNRSENRWTPKVYSASLSHRFWAKVITMKSFLKS
jgi:iron complex outermembrane receptor protein